jgi:hypothetical protein
VILYQMAKRLEQRKRLKLTIEQSDGFNEQLVTQKEQVEHQLMTQANRWLEEGNDEFMLHQIIPEAGDAAFHSADI